MKAPAQKTLRRVLFALVALVVIGLLAWSELRTDGLGDGFASGNGRIEATEIDVATKLGGRIREISVDEGDFVQPGQVIARMDTEVLEAQLNQARAQVRQAENAILTAQALVTQRESEKATAEAVVLQRRAELTAAQNIGRQTQKQVLGLEGVVAAVLVDRDDNTVKADLDLNDVLDALLLAQVKFRTLHGARRVGDVGKACARTRAEQLDAGALVDRGARGSRQPIQLQAIDLGNDAVASGADSSPRVFTESIAFSLTGHPGLHTIRPSCQTTDNRQHKMSGL